MSNYLDYLKSIQTTDTFTKKLDYIRFNFQHLIPSSATVLEIGPGLGEFIYYLNSLNINSIDIIDNEKSILTYIKQNFKIRHAYFSNHFPSIIASTQKNYDVIFALQVFEHLPKDMVIPALTTMYQHLNPNGKIIITVPNGANPLNLIERYSDFTHQCLFTQNSFYQITSMSNIPRNHVKIINYSIPTSNLLGKIRFVFQKILHIFLFLTQVINGGVISTKMAPNIILLVNK